ncbi:LPS export ABC transporter permease LptG [Oharaeibacter diazotrophicus]|uniref:Lipopolysaccharide export system permease protein n=1 Tax=Oharaeibacter diazotrophicus TaxID=1920512 RepID=A0A4R6RJG2_9HYPH|nr:LPS export ABC transporter permease LptG [Oharaeibacter diazotrophicus]TDP86761.1 lipopolysaccharide export system permease protein [Oharaeibacter diazotrophicus]BBE71296.1 lipopolysaccharide export system permease protein LptG [Pleomorphomonas sp. SM30]GLS78051.1 LPS export ABC transporter permease LptG [Oharaeibacter diazotrophicus]
MILGTLGRYFGAVFLRWIGGLFLGAALLVFLIDVLELMRTRLDDAPEAFLGLLAVSALRVPLIMEQVLPFAVLIGSIAAFVSLSRRSELAVARASGLSVWQFAAPGVALALALGVLATTVYNPAAVAMKVASDRLAGELVGRAASILSEQSSESWLRQRTAEGDAILWVGGVADGGTTVIDPVAWQFDKDGRLERRIEAPVGRLGEGTWIFERATVVDTDGTPRREAEFRLPTALTPDQVRGRFASPDSVSFWALPGTIGRAAASGLPPYRFRLQFHALLSRPLLLAAMVLIAATVSLGSARSGGTGRMILGGVVAGFMLYVITEIARDLGSEGLVPAALAAWAPAVVATWLGSTVLLFREDG